MALPEHLTSEYQTPLLERWGSTLAAAGCLGILSYLLVRGEPFADPTLAVIARTFMSLAAAIFGATIPGFLHIGWSGRGLFVRAGGALALFVLTYFATPGVASHALAPPSVALDVPKVIDIRSFRGPTVSYDEMLVEDAIVIARMAYTNDAQPARNAFLKQEDVQFSIGNQQYKFAWQYFVNIFPGANCWPCIEESVSTTTVPSGGAEAHETLFSSRGALTWRQFVEAFLASSEETLTFTLIANVDGQSETSQCVVDDAAHWRAVTRQWMQERQGRYPNRLILPCLQPG
jgi:hypothetical protein